jgi:hypothetical protein
MCFKASASLGTTGHFRRGSSVFWLATSITGPIGRFGLANERANRAQFAVAWPPLKLGFVCELPRFFISREPDSVFRAKACSAASIAEAPSACLS